MILGIPLSESYNGISVFADLSVCVLKIPIGVNFSLRWMVQVGVSVGVGNGSYGVDGGAVRCSWAHARWMAISISHGWC
jgi:hypothetical protein